MELCELVSLELWLARQTGLRAAGKFEFQSAGRELEERRGLFCWSNKMATN